MCETQFIMKKQQSMISAALGIVLATSCCWLPWLALALGGAAGLSVVSEGVEKYGGWLIVLGIGLVGWSGWKFFQKRKKPQLGNIVLQSLLTCPNCGFQRTETMPSDACQFFYECENCRQLLRPKPGDCCVFCSYGSVKCPPIQLGKDCCV